MIEVIKLETKGLKDAPYRDTWPKHVEDRPQAAIALFNNLVAIVDAGGTLPIHVAQIQVEKSGDSGWHDFVVLDGHMALDVYRHKERPFVHVIAHDDIRTFEAARAAYISFNYLRSTGWLRDCIMTRETLVEVGATAAVQRMADPDLARDLISRDDKRWKEFTFLGTEEPDPMEAMFGSVGTEG